MRKQTKIAAIVSAAALLAIGASMTSFAATGWQEEDGTWVYYNKNEERVTEEWEKSGDNWFYLDDNGEMAVDALIEDDDDYFYVDANGAMVRNQWVAIDNEDAGEDDEPDVWWYYFGANGKAYKKGSSHNGVFKKSINGKTYAFNEDGQMQYGWVDSDGNTDYNDDAYQNCQYYFGDENDGAMTTGWREIALTDVADADQDQPGDSYWDEDQVRWFWFKSSGKKQTSKENKTINGRKYGFDDDGRMIADWYSASANDSDNSLSRRVNQTATAGDTTRDYAETFSYYSSPEDGARYTKGWFKVIPGYYLNYGDYDDGTERWYYADGSGKLVAGEIKSIKGKKYAFDEKGSMISGLALLKVDSSNKIDEYPADDGAMPYDTEDNFDDTALSIIGTDYKFYYFSNDADHDGTMKTGVQKVTIDGDTFSFKFEKSGTKKGQGVNGLDDKKYYVGGKLQSASSDDKIIVIDMATYETYTISDFIKLQGLTSKTLTEKLGKASKDDAVYGDGTLYDDIYKIWGADKFRVVNTSGTVVKSGSKKDGDDFKVVLSGNEIQQIIVED